MRTYVSPLGYDSTRVTRPLLRYGVEPDDTIVVLRPKDESDDTRADRAVRDVQNMLEQIEPTVSVTVQPIPFTDLRAAIRACLDVFAAARGDLLVNFGGGARDVFLPFAIAATTVTDEITAAFQYSDIDGSVRELALPSLLVTVPAAAQPTLQLVSDADGETTLPDLTAASEHSKSTVTRHLQALASGGLVTTERHGKVKYVSLTLTGELYCH
ncbi:CRISPR locus-related DNA-binding protein [Halobellus sp. Atlit-31R]|nr:CRISPR locus-related DNA-binding protein [Halobellus sp. Atlit-31R]